MPVVWGVLNVTPDSFSDGGRFTSVDEAVGHARAMQAQGADVIDVGGESTRPGAERVTPEQEKERVLPVVEHLASDGMVVSIDTMRAEVAAAAVAVGAQVVNDVSGGRADPDMHEVVADLGVPYVVMHWRTHSDRMNEWAVYDDPVRQVCDEIMSRSTTRYAVASTRIGSSWTQASDSRKRRSTTGPSCGLSRRSVRWVSRSS
jgi:dihydropteroate synthase